MFQTFRLHHQEVFTVHTAMVGICHTGLLTACEQAVSKPVWHIPLLCVQWKTPDDGQRNSPKHVEFSSKNKCEKLVHLLFFGGATARGGPWPPLQYASKPLDPLLYLSIRLFPSFSGPWTRHPAISFLVFLFVLLHTAFRTTSFLELRCLAFFLYDQAIVFIGI